MVRHLPAQRCRISPCSECLLRTFVSMINSGFVKWRGVLLLALCAVFACGSGCFLVRWPHRLPDGRWAIRGLADGLPPLPEDPHSVGIDFNAIYVFVHKQPSETDAFSYVRFWPNGRAIFNWVPQSATPITAPAVDDFSRGVMARWSATATTLTIQTLRTSEPLAGQIYVRNGRVVDDGNKIVFYEAYLDSSRWSRPDSLDLHYVRQPVAGMRREPDW